MSVLSCIKIAIPLLIFVLHTDPVKGFATESCTHDKFSYELLEMMNCMDENNYEALDKGLEIYMELTDNHREFHLMNILTGAWDLRVDICSIFENYIEKGKKCMKGLIGHCFDEKLNSVMSELDAITRLNCTPLANLELNMTTMEFKGMNHIEEALKNFALTLEGGEISTEKLENFTKRSMDIIGPNPEEYLKGLITFDKECTWEQRGQAISSGPFTCGSKYGEDFAKELEDVDLRNLKVMNTSELLNNVLENCLSPNQCFSPQEMKLVKDIVTKIYVMLMNWMSKLCEEFGSCSNILENAPSSVELPGNQSQDLGGMSEMALSALGVLDLEVEEYKGTYKEKFEKMMNAGKTDAPGSGSLQLLPTWAQVVLIAVGIMAINPHNTLQ